MKVYALIVLLITYIVLMFGLFLPILISAKSGIAVAAGMS